MSRGRRWIDDWLMSCRVLKRGVERMLRNELVRYVRARGLEEIRGAFIPTGRNELVRNLYADLGFSRVQDEPERVDYCLTLRDATPLEHFVRLPAGDCSADE